MRLPMTRKEAALAFFVLAFVAFFFAIAPDHRVDYGHAMSERYKRD